MKVKCPQCKLECEYSTENEYRPFCSKRCRLIDLGEWADEKYTIKSENPITEDELEEIAQQFDFESDWSESDH